MRRFSLIEIACLLPLVVLLAGCGAKKSGASGVLGPGAGTTYDMGHGLTVESRAPTPAPAPAPPLTLGALANTPDAIFPYAYGAPITGFRAAPSMVTASARVAFVSPVTVGGTPIPKIWTMGTDGSNPAPFQYNPTNERQTEPAFAPNGYEIAYVTWNPGTTQTDLYSNRVGYLTNNADVEESPAFSPDGRKVVFASTPVVTAPDLPNKDIYVFGNDPYSTGSTPARLTTDAGIDEAPSYSPDGTKIVFVSDRVGEKELYLMGPDGSNQTRLTSYSGNDLAPVFSPNGQKILFVRDGRISQMSPTPESTTNIVTALTSGPNDADPAFSPDGTKIVFTRDNNLYLMNALPEDPTTNAPVRLTLNAGGGSQATLELGEGLGRTLVGPAGSDSGYNPPFTGTPAGVIAPLTAYFGGVGMPQSSQAAATKSRQQYYGYRLTLKHPLAFYATTASTLKIEQVTQNTVPYGEGTYPLPIMVKVTADSIPQALQDNGMRMPVTAIVGAENAIIPSPVSGLLITFNPDFGDVVSVLAISRSRGGAPVSVSSAGTNQTLVSGSFDLVVDRVTGQRYEGVKEVQIDKNGHVLEAR